MQKTLVKKIIHPLQTEGILPVEWNKVVENSEIGYFTQLYEWMEMCRQSMGFEKYPLVKYDNDRLSSVFPLVYDKNKRELQSPPLTGIGGPTHLRDLSYYLKEIRLLATDLKAESIKIQLTNNCDTIKTLHDFCYNTDHILPFYVLNLSGVRSFEEVKTKIFDKNARRGLRRSLDNGVVVEYADVDQDILLKAYDIYQETMVHHEVNDYLSRDFFVAIADKFKDYTVMFKTIHEGEIIGVAICFIVNNRLKTWLLLGKIKGRKLFANYALYSHVIQYALSRQIPLVDFGPSGVFSKAHEIKVSHGGKQHWVVTAVWLKSPVSRLEYALRKRFRKWVIMHPKSRISKIYKQRIIG